MSRAAGNMFPGMFYGPDSDYVKDKTEEERRYNVPLQHTNDRPPQIPIKWFRKIKFSTYIPELKQSFEWWGGAAGEQDRDRRLSNPDPFTEYEANNVNKCIAVMPHEYCAIIFRCIHCLTPFKPSKRMLKSDYCVKIRNIQVAYYCNCCLQVVINKEKNHAHKVVFSQNQTFYSKL